MYEKRGILQPEWDYIYLGDKLTHESLKNKPCNAVRRADGKCIRSKMSTMLVVFENGKKCIVLARRLRKIKNEKI